MCIKSSPGFGLVVTGLLLCKGVRHTLIKFAGSAVCGQVIHIFPEVRIDFSQMDESALSSKANMISERCLLHLTRNNQKGVMKDGCKGADLLKRAGEGAGSKQNKLHHSPAQKPNTPLGCINYPVLPLQLASRRPQLEHWLQLWALHFGKDMG